MNSSKYFFLLSFLLICSTMLSTQTMGQYIVDGFMIGKRNTSIALSYSSESYDEFYRGSELTPAPPLLGGEVKTTAVSLYAKYGFSRRMDAIINIPYIKTEGQGDASMLDQDFSGLQDISVFARFLALRQDISFGRIDLMPTIGITSPLSDYQPDSLISIGNGTTALETVMIGQLNFSNGIFINATAGYSFRKKDVPDALIWSAKVGFAHSNFYFDAWINNQTSNSDAPDIGDMDFMFSETRVNYTQVGVTAYYPFTETFGAAINYGQYVSGRNIGKSQRITLALVINFFKA